jgi:hypothetical protein
MYIYIYHLQLEINCLFFWVHKICIYNACHDPFYGLILLQQKIVMKVQMNCQKCQRKALQVAAEANG